MSGNDLPTDLLCAIYSRCYSLYDRARFAAVCKSWSTAASWQPKVPALPLLLPWTGNSSLDQKARAYNPEDGRVLRSRFPWFPYGKQVVGSQDGGWIATATGGRVEIMNLFTRGCRVPVKGYMAGISSIEKVVFSEDPTSQGCILAALTSDGTIGLYRLVCPGAGWTVRGCDADFVDIAFCNHKLYGLSDEGHEYRLYELAIGVNEHDESTMTISFIKLITMQWPETLKIKYIFTLRGKLAVAAKVRPEGGSKAVIFTVSELVASSDTTQQGKYTWVEVTSLGDHALFLGPRCCKAVHVSEGRRGEVQANRIYYSKRKSQLIDDADPEYLDRLDLGSCVVHCYQNQGVHHHLERIISQGYHYHEERDGINGRNNCTWILPPQV